MPTPLVTAVSSRLKHYVSSNTQVVTPEEVKQSKREMLNTVKNALSVFNRNMADGKVEILSTTDLDRLVKLNLLLSGEADSISGKPTNQTEHTDVNEVSRAAEILNKNDPDVQSLFDKLYNGYNQLNDKEV